jgi:hypothetical protein
MLRAYLPAPLHAGKESPPPGTYTIPGSVGCQVMSTKESAPGVRIGTGRRAMERELAR